MKRYVFLTITFFFITCLAFANNSGYYLFSYFTDHTPSGQQVRYATSEDGIHFTPLNNNEPVINSDTISISGGVRDPHIIPGKDGHYRMVLTDMDMSKGKWTNRGIVTDEEYANLKSHFDKHDVKSSQQASIKENIVSGIPWYDQRDSIVSAHGANIIRENGKYYMFGEFKTDSVNAFKGFSCYSSPDLVTWTFERIAFKQQDDGRMGENRVGERPKVMKCPATGEYVMIMHSDDLRYKDPCTVYATSKTIDGEYEYQGPLLYKGKPVRKWDIGSFTDKDGKSYLLVHHGDIYRFARDYHSLDSCMSSKVAGVGESPAMLHHNGRYYWFSSHTTSWERNDNMYVSSSSLSGPWSEPRTFAPEGTNTWNSQTTFILPIINENDTTFMFMGDRWSFPKQRSAATYVWQPIKWVDDEPTIPEFLEAWSPSDVTTQKLMFKNIDNSGWKGSLPSDCTKYNIALGEKERIYIKGETSDTGGYARVKITDIDGKIMVDTPLDFYSLAPSYGLRYVSPQLPEGEYLLEVTVSDMKSNWRDKKRSDYGSKGHNIIITEVGNIL